MENQKVKVISNSNAQVFLNVPELRLRRTWFKKGQSIPIELDTLRDAMFEPGVESLFTSGILYIEDMAVKVELGLEPEGYEEPQNIIILSEADMKKYLTVLSLDQFKEKLDGLTQGTAIDIAEYAIKNELAISAAKNKALLKASGIDVTESIRLNKAAEDKTEE